MAAGDETEDYGFSNRVGQGGFTGGAQMHDMAMDPTFAGDFGASQMAGVTDESIAALMGNEGTIENELNALALREVEAEEEEENQFLASIINPTSYDDIIGSATFRDPKADLNKGHFGSGWLPDIIENFKTLVGKEFERSKQKTVDHLTNQGMTKKEAQKAVADDEGIVSKISGSIDDLIQTINPLKTDWAQENLYGTQAPVVDPLQSKQDFMASKAFLSEEQEKALYGKLVGATAATKKERLSIQKQSKALEKEIEELKQKIAVFDLNFQTFDDDETLEAYTNQIGISPLVGQGPTPAQAESLLGAPGSWYGGTPVQEELGSGVGALSPSNLNVSISQAAQDLQNQSDLSNLIALEESGPTLDELLAGQPIGSSPLAPAYNEAFNYKGADFPGNAGINAVGTQFGPQWGKTPDPLWAGETPPGPLPPGYKANMGEALKAWDSPLQSAYRPEGQLPDTILQSPQDLVLEQLKQAPPAWMNQGWPDELPEYDQFFQKEDGGLAGMQEGVYGPPSLTESAQSAFGPPDSTEGLSPVVIDQIESNPAVKEAYVNARQAIIDQLLAAKKSSHEDYYPGSQAAAVAAGFWGPMATKINPAYSAYKDKQRAIMGLNPGQQFKSNDWINAFGGLTPEQINALVGY